MGRKFPGLRLGLKLNGKDPKNVCGEDNSTINADNCKVVGYITRRHDAMMTYIHKKTSIRSPSFHPGAADGFLENH